MEFYNCHVTKEAIANVNYVLNNRWINQGPFVKKLEETIFPNDYSMKYPLTTNSCTSALHIALELSNVMGKEVILPAKTFVATGIAVLMAGGIPVFADIDARYGSLLYRDVISKINENTAAVIGVSWGGSDVVCGTLRKIKKSVPGIRIIEDAAHSFGSYNDLREYIDFVCYSFQAIKMVTCGDGGLLVCKDENDYKNAKAMRWFGINKDKMTFSDIGERQFNIERLGYKYNMNDLNAAMLIGNLSNLDKRIARRQEIYTKYLDELSTSVRLMYHSLQSSCWLCPVLVDRRNDFIKALRSRGVPACKTDSRIDINTIFGGKSDLPETEYFDSNEANIPIHEDLTDDDVKLVIDSIEKGW